MTKTDPPDDGWEAPSRNALRQLGGARRGKPAGAMLLNTMGGYHHECWLDGDYCGNHYEIFLEEKPVILGSASKRSRKNL